MSADTHDQAPPEQPQKPVELPSVRVLAFTVLSLLAEAAAAHLGAPLPGGDSRNMHQTLGDLNEARLAIDAANAVLGATRSAMPPEERLAIESLLTQLQVEYVKRAGR